MSIDQTSDNRGRPEQSVSGERTRLRGVADFMRGLGFWELPVLLAGLVMIAVIVWFALVRERCSQTGRLVAAPGRAR